MKYLRITLLIVASLFSVYVLADDEAKYQGFDENVQLIDVRSDAEWEAGHHPSATHIPHTMILDGKGFAELDKNKPVVLYCRSGGRAQRAKDFLEAQGFTNVTNAAVSYTHLRAHETVLEIVWRLLLEKIKFLVRTYTDINDAPNYSY